jgi:CheY-like chemotaxis protein
LPTGQTKLAGKRILVVEDEMLVATNLEDTLTDLGAVVIGPAMRVEEALDLAAKESFDVAILDVNLNGTRSYAVAELIQQRGLPFIFATGYGHVLGADSFRDVPTLAKPYRTQELCDALAAALAGRRK